jgi:hypothetical protein
MTFCSVMFSRIWRLSSSVVSPVWPSAFSNSGRSSRLYCAFTRATAASISSSARDGHLLGALLEQLLLDHVLEDDDAGLAVGAVACRVAREALVVLDWVMSLSLTRATIPSTSSAAPRVAAEQRHEEGPDFIVGS